MIGVSIKEVIFTLEVVSKQIFEIRIMVFMVSDLCTVYALVLHLSSLVLAHGNSTEAGQCEILYVVL